MSSARCGWRDGDRYTDATDIENEMAMMKLAKEHDIPCPDVRDDLSKMDFNPDSSSTDKYHMIVMAQMRMDDVLPKDVLTFAKSLVNACIKLHNDAGILHCDIKSCLGQGNSNLSSVST